MQKTVVRIMALLLVVLMCLTLLPIRSWADEGDPAPCSHVFDKEDTAAANALKSPATCIAPAVYYKSCSLCGAVSSSDSDTFTSGEPLGHDLGEWTDTATCTAPGTRSRGCSRCEYTETEASDALGHNWGEYGADSATCTTGGQRTRSCQREGCSATDTVETEALGHLWNDGEVTTEPTCSQKGVKTFTCQREGCGATQTEEIDTIAHSYGDWQTVSAATCTAKGKRQRTCTVCNHVEEEELAPLSASGEHQWGEWNVTKEADCGVTGSRNHTCSVCHITESEEIPALTHQWGNEKILQAATCTHAGTKQLTCSHCGATKTEEIPALSQVGHSFNSETGVCNVCHISGYRLTAAASALGTASINGATPAADYTTVVEAGTALTVTFAPKEGAVLDSVKKNGVALSNPQLTYSVTAVAGGSDTYEATFRSAATPGSKTPAPEITELTGTAIKALAEAKIPDLIAGTQYKSTDIKYRVFNVEAKWSDGTFMTTDDLKANPVTFTLGAPAGTSSEAYCYEVWHFGGKTFDKKYSNSLTVTADALSPLAVYAFPQTIIVDQATRTAPDVHEMHFLDDAGGAITGTTTEMLFREEGSTTYAKCEAGKTPVHHAGTYYVHYPETTTTKASAETEVIIGSYYTVTAKHLYGKGTYYTDRPKLSGYDNVFVVPSGENISFTFTPDSGYWLHEINKNGKYVGYESVKKVYTTKITDKSLVSFGFSSSTSSPKTADPNQDVLIWGIAELVSLIGMTSITWYLFRRKEY